MFWIHGGGWIIGSNWKSGKYNGAELAARHGVVVVAANYRLDALGWLALDDLRDPADGSYGNYGLKDQRFALQWAHRNVPEFGGDPALLTLFGQSAGGFSVCQHLASPGSNGLFSRAIMESGGCEGPWIVQDGVPAMQFGDSYARDIGCGQAEPAARVACLRGLPLRKVLEPYTSWLCPPRRGAPPDPWCNTSAAHAQRGGWPGNRAAFAPIIGWGGVVDGSQSGLPDYPLALFRKGQINTSPAGATVPVILGTTEDEVALFYAGVPVIVPGVRPEPGKDPEAFATIMRHLVKYNNAWPPNSTVAKITQQYPSSAFASEPYRFVVAATDLVFRSGTRKAARALTANGNAVFLYSYNFHSPKWRDPSSEQCAKQLMIECGVKHADEVAYVFGTLKGRHTANELAVVEHIQTYWANLAHHGDPNGPAPAPTSWEPYSAATDAYLEITESPRMRRGLHQAGCDFWGSLPESKSCAAASGGCVAGASGSPVRVKGGLAD